MFITFEGIDGSGKSTCINKLKEYIEKHLNVNDFLFTREPGGFNLKECEQIREILLNKENDIDPMTEMLLYLASRKLHVEKLIKPAIQNNKVVLCDRFFDSSIAYQGNSRKLGMDMVKNMNLTVLNNFKPDFTFYFKIDFETSMNRMLENRRELDRLENAEQSFFKDAIEGYNKLVQDEPNRFIVIDATQDQEKVFAIVLEKIKEILGLE